MSSFNAYFSADYRTARDRFRRAVQSLEGKLGAAEMDIEGPNGEPLSIDFARIGPERAPHVLVVSSGTHGVEGFFGSAVQLAMLERRLTDRRLPPDVAIVFVHAINPYGFAHIRRVNEENIDLNRNFMLPGQPFEGADPAYVAFDSVLNPTKPAGRIDTFLLQAVGKIARHGFSSMKNAIVQGQYEFAKGLFYGGKEATRSQRALDEHLPQWLEGARRVVHLDLHTGMGEWGTYILAVSESVSAPTTTYLKHHFGDKNVEALDPSGVLYEIRGVLGSWLRHRFEGIEYHCMLAEFGTYKPLQVLSALREENRAFHWGTSGPSRAARAKARLKESFAPASESWRKQTVSTALDVIERGIVALSSDS